MIFFKALALFLGTVIGVGIFGLPYAAMKSGFFVMAIYIIFMAVLAIIIHSLYAEIAITTQENLRLPGYTSKYLNPAWKKISFLIIIISLVCGILPYIIIGGSFLNSFLAIYIGNNLFLCTILVFFLGAYFIYRDIGNISAAELLLVILIFVILAIFAFIALPVVKISNLLTFNKEFLFFPYGIVLFSLWGTSVIPEIEEYLQKEKRKKKTVDRTLRNVVVIGILTTAIAYLFFVYIVLGAAGGTTSKEALSGMEVFVGKGFGQLGYIFGLICCFTSFITIGLYLKKTLWYDFGFSKNLAWFITLFIPLGLFIFGVRNFLSIISFSGAISVGLESIVIVFLYRAITKKKFDRKVNAFLYFIVLIFLFGIIFEALNLFNLW